MKKISGILIASLMTLSVFGGVAAFASQNNVKSAEAADMTLTINHSDYLGKGNWRNDDTWGEKSGTAKNVTLSSNNARYDTEGIYLWGSKSKPDHFTISSTKYNFKKVVISFKKPNDDIWYESISEAGDGAILLQDKSSETSGYWQGDTPKDSLTFYSIDSLRFYKFVITYTAKTFNVTYDANGGTGETVDTTDYEADTKATIKNSSFVAPEGKAFSHWNTEADGSGTNYNVGDQITMTSNITLYAQYSAKMTVSATGYTGNYDGLEHTGKVTVTVPESGYITQYGTDQSDVTFSTCPSFSDVGEYTVYYRVRSTNYATVNDSFKVIINENDKSELNSVLENAIALYEALDDKTTPEAVELNDAILVAQEVSNDKNVTEEEIKEALDALLDAVTVCGRESITDNVNGVTVESDGAFIPNNISLYVEVRTGVKATEGSVEYENIKKLLAGNEKISNVFEIKLIKTVGGEETEIQPSDIKEGMKLIIHIALPEGINTESLKILHIHNNGEAEFVENYSIANNEVVFEVSSLSELAFVQSSNTGLPGWAIAIIIIGGLLLVLLLLLLVLFIFCPKYVVNHYKRKVVRVIKIRTKNSLFVLLGTDCKIYKRPEETVFKTKEEALKLLKK